MLRLRGIMIGILLRVVIVFLGFSKSMSYDLDTNCPFYLYSVPPYARTYSIMDMVLPNGQRIPNKYYIDKAGYVVAACYMFWGDNNGKRPKNPDNVINAVKSLSKDYEAGHIVPHNNGGTNSHVNYFPQDISLNRGFWVQFEKSILHKHHGETVITFVFEHPTNKKLSDFISKNNKNLDPLIKYKIPSSIKVVILDDDPQRQNDPLIWECMHIRNVSDDRKGNIIINSLYSRINSTQRTACHA